MPAFNARTLENIGRGKDRAVDVQPFCQLPGHSRVLTGLADTRRGFNISYSPSISAPGTQIPTVGLNGHALVYVGNPGDDNLESFLSESFSSHKFDILFAQCFNLPDFPDFFSKYVKFNELDFLLVENFTNSDRMPP